MGGSSISRRKAMAWLSGIMAAPLAMIAARRARTGKNTIAVRLEAGGWYGTQVHGAPLQAAMESAIEKIRNGRTLYEFPPGQKFFPMYSMTGAPQCAAMALLIGDDGPKDGDSFCSYPVYLLRADGSLVKSEWPG